MKRSSAQSSWIITVCSYLVVQYKHPLYFYAQYKMSSLYPFSHTKISSVYPFSHSVYKLGTVVSLVLLM